MKSQRVNQFNEINITPLTDIFLVLLIIMMVVTPLMDMKGLSMAILTVGNRPVDMKEKPKPMTLRVGPLGELSVNDERVPVDALANMLKAKLPEFPDGVLIEADPEAPHEALTVAMAAVSEAQIPKVALVEKAESAQKKTFERSPDQVKPTASK